MVNDLITRTHSVGGHSFEFVPPPTTRDVLDWELWIQCFDGSDGAVASQLVGGLEWACKWLSPQGEWTTAALDELLQELADEPGDYLGLLVDLCNAISASAGLPDAILDDMAALLDRQNEVDPKFRGTTSCTCARCRKGIENPRGMVCIYDDFDPRAIEAIARVSGLHSASEPYYITQTRAVLLRADGRRLAYMRKEREEREEYERIMKSKGLIRG